MSMPVLDVVIGLALVYLLMAILCSSALEMLAGLFDLRGEMLWKGIESMLGGRGAGGGAIERVKDLGKAAGSNFVSGAPSPQAPQAGPQVQTLSTALLSHPAIDSVRNGKRAPSYLAADRFASALIDTLGETYRGAHQLYGDFTDTVRALPEGPLKKNLEIILKETGGDAALVKERVQKWYDEVMERVSGWYKRQTQWLLLALGFVVAAALNVDSIELAQRMWKDPMLRAVAVKSAEAYAAKGPESKESAKERALNARSELDALGASGLPIGWPLPWAKDASGIDHLWGSLWSMAGWAITALAVSLGAPYWYDILLKLLPMRSAGGKPPSQADRVLPSSARAPQSPGPGGAAPQPAGPPAIVPPPMPFRNALNPFETSLTGDDVREIQEVLGLKGDEISGNLDQPTRAAIIQYQRSRGLTPSGELNSDLVGDLLRKRRTL